MRLLLDLSIALLFSATLADGQGCCSHKFSSCDGTWCGSNKEACENCSGNFMVWLPNGALPANSCKQRWEGCGDNPDACCTGATCRDNGNSYMQCLADADPPLLSNPSTPTNNPVPSPTQSPPVTPTQSPVAPTQSPVTPTQPPATPTSSQGCCSQKFLSCDGTWCGSNKEACENCSGNPSMVWLPNGALPANSCKQRWEGCGGNPGACCTGATCRDNGNGYMQCLADTDPPLTNPTPPVTPTPSPIQNPTNSPVNPTASPANPTIPPTSPTPSPVSSTASPVSPTPAPVNPTPAPVSPTASPVSPTPAPVNPTQAPISPTGGGDILAGKATYYGGNVNGNACGFIDLPQVTFPFGYASAAGGDTFDEGYGCGACFEITCVGPYDNNPSCHCSPDTPSVIVQVTDQCPECSDTHFDLNPAAMDEVVGDGLAGTCGIIETLVRRVNCDIQSNIKIRSKSGTSGWWYGLHVDDVAGYGDIASVRLKGFGRGDFDIICDKSQGASFWACTIPNAPVRAPVGVELTDSAGRVLVGEDVITNLNGNQEFDFGSNFAAIPTGPPPPVTPNPTLAPVTPTLPPTGSPTITPSPTAESVLLSTTNAMSAWDVFQGLNHLTKVNSDSPRSYALVAGGGAAGNGGSVVTESQAYALLITGTVLASWDTHAGKETTDNGADRSVAIDAFEGYFNFWKKMCQNSVGGSTCQGSGNYCYDEETQAYSVCLPDWKQKADGSAVEGTGPAPDGDEDAIVGIILAVKAVENDSPKPSWYDEARKWADASATAFFEFNVDDSRGDHRLVKLGACWGGWDTSGNNPSYHSPGSYKAMRDFQKDFPSADRHGYEPYSENEWNKLIDTSHEVLRAVQCSNDGAMVPNWATVSISNNGSIEHSGGSFSGSGTPQYEYGAEAARTTWRVALDAALYPGDSADWAEYLDPYLVRLRDGHTGVADRYWGNTFSNCRTPNTSQDISIFGGWLNNAFIYAPTLSALIAGAPEDALLVDDAGSLMAAELPGDYYPRCWALLGNLMLNGAMESAGATALSG